MTWTHFIRLGRGPNPASLPASSQTVSDKLEGVHRRAILCRIDELERETAGEFGTDELAPLLAELAACRAELH